MGKVLVTATVQSHICQFHRPLVQMLHEHGYEVHIAARNNLAEKNGLALDFADAVFDVPFSRSPASWQNLQAYKQLKEILAKTRYDFIHCNTPVGGIVTRLCARKARKSEGTKVFYTAHGFHFYQGAPKKNWLLYYPIEKHFAKYCDKLITVNEEDFAFAKSRFSCEVAHIHGVGVYEERYHPITEQEKQKLRMDLGLPATAPIVLCVGELLPNKNQQLVIRAFQTVIDRFPDARLLIVGNGKNETELKALTRELGLSEHIVFTGYLPNLYRMVPAIDISVSCSKREGLPLNLIEAMMTGNPVAATDNRGHRELITNGENGYLFVTDSPDEVANALIRLIDDHDLRARFAQRGMEKAKRYTARSVMTELEEIYFGKQSV